MAAHLKLKRGFEPGPVEVLLIAVLLVFVALLVMSPFWFHQ